MSTLSSVNTDKNSRTILVGQAKLRRTIFNDSTLMRLYLDPDTYFKLGTVSHYAECTRDELVREIIKQYLDGLDEAEKDG